MKADWMFNTFAQGQQPSIHKRKKLSQNRKNIDITNLSAIHLNPWHEQGTKSFVYFQGENFVSSPKITSNYSTAYKQSPQKSRLKINQKRTNYSTKKWNISQVEKNYLSSSKQKRMRQNKQQKNLMNKTISVHIFSSDKLFNQTNSFIKERRKSMKVEKQKNSRKTIINNPMYLKFCNTFISDKQKLPRRKKTLSNFDPLTLDLQSEKVVKIKQKITTFSVNQGDINKAKNIHEVRKRLKSNSELSSRCSFENQAAQKAQRRIFQNQKLKHTENLQPQQFSKQQKIQTNRMPINQQKQVIENADDKRNFRLGQRKNLYIGYRKFFHPLYHVIAKDRKLLISDEPQKKEIINFETLQNVFDLEKLKKNLCN